MPASRRMPADRSRRRSRAATGRASRRRRRSATPSIRVGSRPLSGPPEVSSHGSNVAESRTAGGASEAVAERRRRRGPARPASATPQACQIERRQRPRQHRAERPAAARRRRPCSAMPSASFAQRVAGRGRRRRPRRTPPGRARPRRSRRRRRRPARRACAGRRLSGRCRSASSDLAVDGADREVEPVARGRPRTPVAGRRRLEGGVALAERPDGARQPVGRVAVGRVGQLHRIGARVQRAVGLHPEHDVAGVRAGRGLQVGQAAQQLVGLRRGCPSSRSAASAAGRRPRRGRRRRR